MRLNVGAKAIAEELSASTPADSRTITANYTRPGVIPLYLLR